jgi:hypothetical protein
MQYPKITLRNVRMVATPIYFVILIPAIINKCPEAMGKPTKKKDFIKATISTLISTLAGYKMPMDIIMNTPK